MSFSAPSHVSATTGSDQSNSNSLCTSHSMTASRTTPTLCVFVIITGPARNPDSSSQVVPVISPLPFSVNQPPKTGSPFVAPRGKTAVTPVRTGPRPTTSLPSPVMIVLCPTVTPATSVMALRGPGLPHVGGCLPAGVARLGKGLHHCIAECPWRVAPQLAEIRRRRMLLHVEHGGSARRGEWRPPGDRLEQHDAQRVQIGPAVDVG